MRLTRFHFHKQENFSLEHYEKENFSLEHCEKKTLTGIEGIQALRDEKTFHHLTNKIHFHT